MSLPDARARARATTDFATSLVVVAGAGTGKTSLLVERALNMIIGRGIPLGKMVAITFTRKAAAEMSQRLAEELERLAQASRDEPPPPESVARRSFKMAAASA